MKKDEAISILATSLRPREPKNRARYDEAVKMAIKALNCSEIPNNSDTISRQAAIEPEAISKWKKEFREYVDSLDIARDDWKGIIEYIDELPSAQSERTCVNCGRTANNGGWYADGRTRCPIEEHYALPKDGYCHLWEKRNVTDDDYPERMKD